MVDQYKLRLGDGTVLAVDEQGLRSWLLDGKAMAQRPGSSDWRPLSEILAALTRENAAAPHAEKVATPRASDDGLPIIPFKRLPAEAPLPAKVPSGDLRQVAAAALDPEGRNEGPWQWPGAKPPADAAAPAPAAAPAHPVSRVAGPTAGPGPVVPDAKGREVHVREGPIDPRAIVYPPVPGEAAVRAAVGWSGAVASGAREIIARLPPPSLPAIAKPLASPEGRQRLKRGLVIALSVAAAIVLGLGVWRVWSRTAGRDSGATGAALVPPPLPAPPPTVPELPKEVQEAMVQLPHLSPATIQLVMASGQTSTSDPPELFRRACLAADRGSSALTDDEARELRALMNAVLGALRRVDRDRVRAYGRLNRQRDLLVDEDRKVAALFARGVRALPAPRRARLQDLSAKAIASGLPPPSPVPGATAGP